MASSYCSINVQTRSALLRLPLTPSFSFRASALRPKHQHGRQNSSKMPPKKEQIGTYYPESGPQAAVPSATRSRLAYRLLSHRRRSGKGPALTVPLCAPQSVTTGSDADSSSLQSTTRRFRRPPSSEEVVVPRQHPTTGFGHEKYDYAGLRQLVLGQSRPSRLHDPF